MSLADEFVERRMLIFQCYKCEHPAMQIVEKESLGANQDGSTKYQVTLKCPRCKASDEFTLNDGEVDLASASINAGKVPNLKKVL